MEIAFSGRTFRFWLLAADNWYEPGDFAITEEDRGIVARTNTLTYGDGSGSTSGLFEVSFARRPHGLSWRARASHAHPIKGIKVAIGALPIGPVMVPLGGEFDLNEGDPGRCFVFPGGYYPMRHVSSTRVEPASGPLPTWAAQFVLLRGGERTLYLHAREYPPRVKKLWAYRWDNALEIRLYSEADACRRSTEYAAPTWHLDEVQDWREAVDDHAAWMGSAYGVRPFSERADLQPWMRRIALVANIHGLSDDGKVCHTFDAIIQRLEQLAVLFPPQNTLVRLVAAEGRFDHNWPDNTPALALGGSEGFGRLIGAARRLGFHVMPHLNVWGASYGNPATQSLLSHQILDPEGRPVTWSFDYDQDEIAEEVFAYISPDVSEWRAVLRRRVGDIIARGVDAVYLDQVGTFVNDRRHDHFRGLRALFAELTAEFPQIQFTCERPTTEVSVALCPVHLGVSGSDNPDMVEMYRRLFGRYIRQFHLMPVGPHRGANSGPQLPAGWSRGRFLRSLERAQGADGIPTLTLTDSHIPLDHELVSRVLSWARQYHAAQVGGSI